MLMIATTGAVTSALIAFAAAHSFVSHPNVINALKISSRIKAIMVFLLAENHNSVKANKINSACISGVSADIRESECVIK